MRYLSIAILSILMSIGCSPSPTVKYTDGSTIRDGDIVHIGNKHASVYHPRSTYAIVKMLDGVDVHRNHDVRPEFMEKCNPKTCKVK